MVLAKLVFFTHVMFRSKCTSSKRTDNRDVESTFSHFVACESEGAASRRVHKRRGQRGTSNQVNVASERASKQVWTDNGTRAHVPVTDISRPLCSGLESNYRIPAPTLSFSNSETESKASTALWAGSNEGRLRVSRLTLLALKGNTRHENTILNFEDILLSKTWRYETKDKAMIFF